MRMPVGLDVLRTRSELHVTPLDFFKSAAQRACLFAISSPMAAAVQALHPVHAGVHGRVTELASATSKKYNIALAVLLARDMDSVVVKDEAVAKDCIKLLKDRKAPPIISNRSTRSSG